MKVERKIMKSVRTAGYYEGKKTLYYDVGPWRCGKITDGVSFSHGDEGSWVISLADLQKILDEANAKDRP